MTPAATPAAPVQLAPHIVAAIQAVPWQHAPDNADAPRGCFVCTHGRTLRRGPDGGSGRYCTCAEVAGSEPVAAVIARSRYGECGPEAKWLHFPGLTA